MIVRRLITFGLIAVPAAMTALLSMRYYFSAVLIAVANVSQRELAGQGDGDAWFDPLGEVGIDNV